jgi:hypothetical protein
MKTLWPLSLCVLAILVALPICARAAKPAAGATSVYTSLAPGDCKKGNGPGIEGDPDSIREDCPGTAGHALAVINEDQKMSVTIVTPDQKEHPLGFWNVITRRLSSIGGKAEWRLVQVDGKPVPTAVIVPVNAYEDANNPYKETPYLAVAKIAPPEFCVTARIPPGPKAAAAARKAADEAAKAPCLKALP